jgi:hypothetical protein
LELLNFLKPKLELPFEIENEIKKVESLAFPDRQKQIGKETNRLYANLGGRMSEITVGPLLRYTKTLHVLAIAESNKEKDVAGESDILKKAKRVPIGP